MEKLCVDMSYCQTAGSRNMWILRPKTYTQKVYNLLGDTEKQWRVRDRRGLSME